MWEAVENERVLTTLDRVALDGATEATEVNSLGGFAESSASHPTPRPKRLIKAALGGESVEHTGDSRSQKTPTETSKPPETPMVGILRTRLYGVPPFEWSGPIRPPPRGGNN